MNGETKVDVLAVMDMFIAIARDCADACPRSAGLRDDIREAEQARDAVAKLIEAAEEAFKKRCVYSDGAVSDRLRAALARIGGDE